MQVIILAGGKGTRLQPYTMVLPKPLMPIGELPILEVVLWQLKQAGADEVIMAVGYLGHLLQAFFQDGGRFGLKITYSYEDHPLGTAGPIGLVLDRLDEDFMIMNGDLLTTLNYRWMFDFHTASNAAATIGVFPREVKIDFGVIEMDVHNRMTGYIEKPTYSFDVSMGVNILKKKVIQDYLSPGQHLDLPDLMCKLHADRHLVQCYREECLWLDIGRLDDYQRANEIFEVKRDQFLPPRGGF